MNYTRHKQAFSEITWTFHIKRLAIFVKSYVLIQIKYCINMRRSMAPQLVRFGVRSWKLSNVGQSLDGWPKIYYLELHRASEGTLSLWSRLHLQSLPPTNPHRARVVGYGPFSLRAIQKEDLCPSSGLINGLMMMMTNNFFLTFLPRTVF
jgi:hypothetical protein